LGLEKRVCVVIHSRANYARIKEVLKLLQANNNCDLQIVVGASGLLFRFGNVAEIVENDGFKISRKVYAAVEGNEPVVMAKTTGLLLIELSQIFYDSSPDLVVTVADRHETLATAAAASYMNIPVCHTQGGEVTGSIDDSVRHAITKLSHLHCVSTKKSFENVVQLGEEVDRVHLTGCPALDIVKNTPFEPHIEILSRYFPQRDLSEFENNFVIVSQHANTHSYKQARNEVLETLQAIRRLQLPTIWLWPNIDSGSDSISKLLREFRDFEKDFPILFVRNFKPAEYVNLLRTCSCLIGNSSSGIRESSLIGNPAVNIGKRQSGREIGENVSTVPHKSELILSAIQKQIQHGPYQPNFLYGDGNAAAKIADLIMNHPVTIEKKFVSWSK
jgi:UDP-hydrolysing UDP-N-acetyl-D-glucosamine 2-epimerase